jgi:hypothetical protein
MQGPAPLRGLSLLARPVRTAGGEAWCLDAAHNRTNAGSIPAPATRELRRPDVADDLSDAIRENAAGPHSASGDAGSMQQHSLTEQIAADKHLASKRAMGRKNLGLTRVKIVSPGAV